MFANKKQEIAVEKCQTKFEVIRNCVTIKLFFHKRASLKRPAQYDFIMYLSQIKRHKKTPGIYIIFKIYNSYCKSILPVGYEKYADKEIYFI